MACQQPQRQLLHRFGGRVVSCTKLLFAGHEGSVEAVAFAHSLALTLTAGMDGKLCIWENASLEVRGTCEHPEVSWPHIHACWASEQLSSHCAV